MKKNRWLMLLAACAIHISIGSVYAYSTLVLPIISETSWSLFATTFIFSIAIFFLGTSASFGGKWVEKYGPRKTGALASLCFTVGLQGSAFAILTHNLPLMYLFNGVICGCAYGIGYVTPVKCIISWFKDKPGFAGGATVMSFGFASMIAGPVMQHLVSNYGLVNNFIILGIVYPIIMFLASFYLDYPDDIIEQDNETKSLTVNEICKTKEFKLLFITFFINILCGIALLAVVSPMIQQVLNFNAFRAAAFVGFIGLSNGIGRIVWSSFSDYFGRKNTIIVFMIIEFVSFLFLPFINNIYVYEILLLLIASGYGGYFAVIPSFIIDLFTKKHLSTIHGRTLFAWGLAGLCASPIISYTYNLTNSYDLMLNIFAVLMGINIILVYNIKCK